MQFEMAKLSMGQRYKIVNSTITPRPIAWITSQSADGIVNAAPYSFFNAVGTEPPLIVLGLLKNPVGRSLKHTASNIVENGEFVINLVAEHDAEKMNQCAADVPDGLSEIDYAGLEVAPSVMVAPPRIASSPVSFECRKLVALDVGTHQTVMIGEILMTHIADAFVSDPKRLYLDTPAMKLIGRTHGSGWYVRTTDQFQMERPSYDPARLGGGE